MSLHVEKIRWGISSFEILSNLLSRFFHSPRLIFFKFIYVDTYLITILNPREERKLRGKVRKNWSPSFAPYPSISSPSRKNSLLLCNFHFSRLSRRTKVAALFHPFHPDRRTRSLGGRTTWVLDRLFTLPPLTNIKDPSRLRAFSISVGPWLTMALDWRIGRNRLSNLKLLNLNDVTLFVI